MNVVDEDVLGFAHGLTSAVAATSVWEVLRTLLSGWALLMVGASSSGVIFHLIHRHHRRVLRRLGLGRRGHLHHEARPIRARQRARG